MPGSTTDAGPRAAGPEPDAQSPDAATKEPSSGKKVAPRRLRGASPFSARRRHRPPLQQTLLDRPGFSTAEGDHGFVALDVVPLVAARR